MANTAETSWSMLYIQNQRKLHWWVKETCAGAVFDGNCDVEGCKAQFTNYEWEEVKTLTQLHQWMAVWLMYGVIHTIGQHLSASFRSAIFVYGVARIWCYV